MALRNDSREQLLRAADRAQALNEVLNPKSNDPKSNDPKSNDPKSNDPKSNDPKSNDPKSSAQVGPQRPLCSGSRNFPAHGRINVKNSSDAVAYPQFATPDGSAKDRPRNVAAVRRCAP